MHCCHIIFVYLRKGEYAPRLNSFERPPQCHPFDPLDFCQIKPQFFLFESYSIYLSIFVPNSKLELEIIVVICTIITNWMNLIAVKTFPCQILVYLGYIHKFKPTNAIQCSIHLQSQNNHKSSYKTMLDF